MNTLAAQKQITNEAIWEAQRTRDALSRLDTTIVSPAVIDRLTVRLTEDIAELFGLRDSIDALLTSGRPDPYARPSVCTDHDRPMPCAECA